MRSTHILGTRYAFPSPKNLPKDKPLIIISNHQSMYDIPPIIWHMRAYHPKFVSKKELGKGIPSVSYNLRHGGGTRSRTGHPKKFQTTGLKILLKKAPSAVVVPISINNSWKLLRYGKFPYGLGVHMTFTVHEPIENKGDLDQLIAIAEEKVSNGITSFK